jgi:hypothetical protein
MRIGLIAALRRTETGTLRGELPLAGRPVLAWQAALLQLLGVERVLCLCEGSGAAVLAVQHMIESGGGAFYALHNHAALPALVRAEDDLVILADGLVPDPAVVQALLGTEGAGTLRRMVATLPADHPLAAAHPEDFERIDAARHWAGVLAMRGAPVQKLADFPADADAISLLLRLALQAGTEGRALAARELAPGRWLLAAAPEATRAEEAALITRAVPASDVRAPLTALAGMVVRRLALGGRGLALGGMIAGGAGLLLLSAGVALTALAPAAAGLGLAAGGAFAAEMAKAYAALSDGLRRVSTTGRARAALADAVDGLAALALWFALAPWPMWEPLAVLGPVTLGLARLTTARSDTALAALASDRASLLAALGLAAALDLLPEALACLALGLVLALLLRGDKT